MLLDSQDNVLIKTVVPGYCDSHTWSVTKFGSSGRVQWTAQNETCDYAYGDDGLVGLRLDSKDDVLLFGYWYWSLSTDFWTESIVYVMKMSKSGNHLWTTERAGLGRYEYVYDGDLDSNNSVVIAGTTSQPTLDGHSTAGGSDVFVMKFSSAGRWLWTAVRGSSADEQLQSRSVQVDSHDNILIAGNTPSKEFVSSWRGKTYNAWDVFVMKFSADGTWLWTAEDKGEAQDTGALRSFQLDSNDDVFILMSTLMKLSSAGSWMWRSENVLYDFRQMVFSTGVAFIDFDSNITMLDSSGQTQYTFEPEFGNSRDFDMAVDSKGDILLAQIEPSEQYANGYKLVVEKFRLGIRQWAAERNTGDNRLTGIYMDSNDDVVIMSYKAGKYSNGQEYRKDNSWTLTKLSSLGSWQWTTGADALEPVSLPQCAPDFFGPSCDMKAFEFESHGGLCLERAEEALCKGILFAASREHWWRCSDTARCGSWFTAKETVQLIYEAELSDLAVDFLSALFGIVLACWWWSGGNASKSSSWFMPLAMIVCFLVDILLESVVVVTATQAANIFSDYAESFCFSQGDGYATIVKLEDLTGTIAQLAYINIGVAVLGGLCDVAQVVLDSKAGLAASAVILTNVAALCELGLGAANFFTNTLQFVDELESIEKAALKVEALEAGHVCYRLPELLLPATAVGMEWMQPLLIIVPSGVVLLCFIACACACCCGGHQPTKSAV